MKMTNRTVKLLLLFGLFSCCTPNGNKENSELECTVEIRNKDLIEAISDYQDFLYKDNKKYIEQGDSIYVGIASKDINDSIFRFILYPVEQLTLLEYQTPFEISMINGHFVIFSHQPVYTVVNNPDKRFINTTEKTYLKYEKKLFPKEYDEQRKGKQRYLRVYEPDNCYLTFLRDSLIDKTFKRGLPFDKIHVMLNGEKVYL